MESAHQSCAQSAVHQSRLLPQHKSSKQLKSFICFSHLRWNFVHQRPQHLMRRFSKEYRVYFFEEPIFGAVTSYLAKDILDRNLIIVRPYLPDDLEPSQQTVLMQDLLRQLCQEEDIIKPTLWYYSPMSLAFSADLEAQTVIYDCMDELSAFVGAPAAMMQNERRLFQCAQLVFTGGYSLYEAKRSEHDRVYAFPSSVDLAHFNRARFPLPEPADQASIPHPRIGHYAVLDERLDQELLAALAHARPDWQFVLLGPIVKIDPASLPQRPNIHYLGMQPYEALPAYLSGWDVAFMPFALNAATRFISPTKTPEYLAAGKRVVSTPIVDVVRTYGERGLVRIAATPLEFIAAIETSLADSIDHDAWLRSVDELLQTMSWDQTWAEMRKLMA